MIRTVFFHFQGHCLSDVETAQTVKIVSHPQRIHNTLILKISEIKLIRASQCATHHITKISIEFEEKKNLKDDS